MSDPSTNLRLPPRIRVWLGLLVGVIFGPLFAGVLVQFPSSEWMGTYPPYPDDCILISAFMGLCVGPAVGLMVALVALAFQLWWWPAGNGEVMSPIPQWTATARVDAVDVPHGNRTERGQCVSDVRISWRTDIQ